MYECPNPTCKFRTAQFAVKLFRDVVYMRDADGYVKLILFYSNNLGTLFVDLADDASPRTHQDKETAHRLCHKLHLHIQTRAYAEANP